VPAMGKAEVQARIAAAQKAAQVGLDSKAVQLYTLQVQRSQS